MSRWPTGITAAYLRHESDERLRRVLEMTKRRMAAYERERPLPAPIVDHDPGDEDDALAASRSKP